MKTRLLMVVPLALALACQVQAADSQIATDNKKIAYAIGVQIGQDLKRSGVDLDTDAFTLAIQDVVAGKEPRLNREEMEKTFALLREQQTQHQTKVATQNKTDGEKFLVENKAKPEIKVLPSGVQYQVIRAGSGKNPTAEDTVVAHYRGTLLDGTEFDNSFKRGTPLTIPVSQVVVGWQDALKAMTVGGKWKVFIPSDLGYGENGTGNIPPNATLIFDIELLEIK